jgi:AraC-like DNA-binding protein
LVDPLAEVVTLLQPGARFSKAVVGAGLWHVRRSDVGQPFYCVVLEGACRLAVDGHEPIALRSGDFILIPAAYGVEMSSLAPPSAETPETLPVALATLMQLVRDEFRERRPAREVILARLLEVLLIEALRSTTGPAASPGLMRGLADERLAGAIRRMHECPTKAWTVAQLAWEAALSRSVFFERFSRAVGVAPMEYLLGWRKALAKNMLRQNEGSVAEIAEREFS